MDDRIFISHATEDKKLALQLVGYIESTTEYKCWMAPRDIPNGKSWLDAINEGVRNCAGIILIFSPHAAHSTWVINEITSGRNQGKAIFPFMITHGETDSSLFLMVNHLQWVDGTGNPPSKFRELVEGLDTHYNATSSHLPTTRIEQKRRLPKWVLFAIAAVVVILVAVGVTRQLGKQEPLPTNLTDSILPSIETTTDETQDEAPVPTKATKETRGERADAHEHKKGLAEKNDAAKYEPTTQEVASNVTTEKGFEQEPETKEVVTSAQSKEEKVEEPNNNVVDTKAEIYKKKYDKATRLYAAKKYKEALKLFEELKKEYPQEKNLDTYIESCNQKK